MIGPRAALVRLRRIALRGRHHALRAVWALFRAAPGRSRGAVESARVSSDRVARVTGWAYSPADPVETVVILVEGEPCAVAEIGAPRPDVAARFRHAPGSGRVGWSANFDLPKSPPADSTVSAIAVTAAGLVERFDPMPLTAEP